MKGRILTAPRTGVRPTQERVREAVFSMLGSVVESARVLDLFAGTGALGLEAWSRGAAEVHWVEKHPATFKLLESQVASLCAEDPDTVRCHCSDALRFISGYRGKLFTLLLADPPYGREGEPNWAAKTLEALDTYDIAETNALMVLELAEGQSLPNAQRWEPIRDKTYGGTRVLVYRLNEAPRQRSGQ